MITLIISYFIINLMVLHFVYKKKGKNKIMPFGMIYLFVFFGLPMFIISNLCGIYYNIKFNLSYLFRRKWGKIHLPDHLRPHDEKLLRRTQNRIDDLMLIGLSEINPGEFGLKQYLSAHTYDGTCIEEIWTIPDDEWDNLVDWLSYMIMNNKL